LLLRGRGARADAAAPLPPALPAAAVSEQYPWLEENGVLDVLIPKKEPLFVAKW
jgi:hypothetical protein